MKQLLAIPFAFSLILISCKHNKRDTGLAKQEQVPEALQENISDISIRKDYGENVLDALYKEIAEKSPELSALEKSLNALPSAKSDSTFDFNRYNDKNQSYYSSASSLIAGIRDTVLNQQMAALINRSVNNYAATIGKHSSFLKGIADKDSILLDMHKAVKIAATIKQMEKFQKEQLPDIAPLEGMDKQMEGVLNQTKKILNQ